MILLVKRIIVYKNFLQEKTGEATKQREERRKKPEPEEQEGMPQHHGIQHHSISTPYASSAHML
jgi:hypothetical protein